MKILITGGAGFIGHALVKHFAQAHEVHVLDSLTYAADLTRLEDVNYKFWKQDITHPIKIAEQFDIILHLAAESHVDNSIDNPLHTISTNVMGTANMLEFARTQENLKLFLYFSTDEVFGPAPVDTNYKEWDRYNSGNPYSASKAAGEELTLAYGNTYKLPVIITHTMNAFGPTQHIEKFIPGTIDKVKRGEKVIIHSSPDKQTSGSRFYIHINDIAEAVEFVINNGVLQEKYNIVGEQEVSNLRVARTIAELLGKPLDYEMVDFHSSRPGHDLRYSLDGSRLAQMGWTPKISFTEGIKGLL